MLRKLMVLGVLLGMSLSFWGCTHTVRGVGRDVESTGQHMQDYNRR